MLKMCEESFEAYDVMNDIIPTNSVSKKGGLYLGNLLAAKDMESLKTKKINYVLTLLPKMRCGDLIKNLEDNGFIVKYIDAQDQSKFNLYSHFEECCKWIEKAMKNGNVLIHCLVGISRSTTITIAYLMKRKKKGWKEMWEYCKKKRPYCEPNDGFKEQLAKWEKKLGIGINNHVPPETAEPKIQIHKANDNQIFETALGYLDTTEDNAVDGFDNNTIAKEDMIRSSDQSTIELLDAFEEFEKKQKS